MRSHRPLQIETFVDPQFQENAYLLWCEGHPDAWIIDPGFAPTPTRVVCRLHEHNLVPAAILLTHGHADHLAGIPELRTHYPAVPIWCPAGEEHMLTDADANLSAPFGFAVVAPAADRGVRPGEALSLGTLSFQVLDVRGHSPAGSAYYCATAGAVFVGDALFAGNIGRTDFPGGSLALLLGNIRAALLTLPADTVVYSGHGPPTTIAAEQAHNPCLESDAFE